MLKIILPIAVGGLIGYCTNYIAIKMLFRPRHEIYIGKWKLPFTPGVIPKNQKRIANAVANAVSEQLLTKDDLLEKIANNEMKEEFVDTVTKMLFSSNNKSEQLVSSLNNVTDIVSDEILTEFEQVDLMPVIREIANGALQEYLSNPMLAMFLNEAVLESVYIKINDSIKGYVHSNGKTVINDFIQKKIENVADAPMSDVLNKLNLTEENVRGFLGSIFDEFIFSMGNSLIEKINIKGIVTEKIEAMKVEDLERLVLYVMENELKMVINLGAILGAVIGIINIFI